MSGLSGYVLQDPPVMLLFAMVRDVPNSCSRLIDFLSKKRKRGIVARFYVGICFGRYDIAIEITCDEFMGALDCAYEIQDEILSDQPHGCISLISCHSLMSETEKPKEIPTASAPIRCYTFFRIEAGHEKNVFSSLEPSDKRRNGVSTRLLWNRSTYSYVLKTQAETFDDVVHHLYSFRKIGGFLKDFCTFVTLDYERTDALSKSIKALINVKACSQNVVDLVTRKFPTNTVFRLGHFDLVIFEERRRLRELFDLIEDLRHDMEQFPTPDRTGTILLFEEPRPALK